MYRRISLLLGLIVILLALTPAVSAGGGNFRASLRGGNEVPPVDSKGVGEALFRLSNDGSELSYRLIVANIDNVFLAHIHCAPEGSNGPVVVTLFDGPPASGPENGILAQGTIAAPNSDQCGADLAALVQSIEGGNTYVNVHTLPGIPSGELRGQIK